MSKPQTQPNTESTLVSLIRKRKETSINDESEICIYRCPQDADSIRVRLLQVPQVTVVDQIESQLKDIIKLENPTRTLSSQDYETLIQQRLGSVSKEEYGVWVFYPWKNMLVHMLDQEEFIKVRTIRNFYKISPQEQEILRGKKVGVIGLSVGQSVALSLAIERLGGELRIADFDSLELSNLNRIRASVHEIGLPKGVVVKREIAEIDPFLKVEFFKEGVNKDNIAEFLGLFDPKRGKLDLVVEECDSFDVKIFIRKHCKSNGIPVVMETSDRGMLDIERFDLDRNYPMLHGRISEDMLNTEVFSEEQKKMLIPQFVDLSKVSKKGLYSFGEVGKTITTWPQLASDVILGGAVCACAARMILLNEDVQSTRVYIDVPSQILSKKDDK